MTEWLHFHFSLSCIGERNGNPLQYSCLENPRNLGAHWAAVYGVPQSWTWLKRLRSSNCITDSLLIMMATPFLLKGLLTVVNVMVIWIKFAHSSPLIPKMSMFTLAISCLTTSNLLWFMDLIFQVPMQYCSLQHGTWFLSPVTSTTWCYFCFGSVFSFFLELFLPWSP